VTAPLSQVMLPDTMPAQFQATYTPIAAAGTQAQIKHLSRLLATQLTAANLGKGYAEIQQQLKKQVRTTVTPVVVPCCMSRYSVQYSFCGSYAVLN